MVKLETGAEGTNAETPQWFDWIARVRDRGKSLVLSWQWFNIHWAQMEERAWKNNCGSGEQQCCFRSVPFSRMIGLQASNLLKPFSYHALNTGHSCTITGNIGLRLPQSRWPAWSLVLDTGTGAPKAPLSSPEMKGTLCKPSPAQLML